MAVGTCGSCRFSRIMADDMTKVQCLGHGRRPIAIPVGPGQMQLQWLHPVMERNDPICAVYQPLLVLDGKDTK